MPRNAGNHFGLKRFEGNRPLLEQLTADRLNGIIDMSEMNRVVFGRNVTGKRLPGGTTINATGGAATTKAANFAFQIFLSPLTGSTTQYNASFYPGLVNGSMFATVGGVPMWQLVPVTVDGNTVYQRPSIIISKGDQMFLSAVVAAGFITTLSISNGTPAADTDSTTSYVIGTCDGTTGAVTQNLRTNLEYQGKSALFSSSGRLITHVWSPAP